MRRLVKNKIKINNYQEINNNDIENNGNNKAIFPVAIL